MSFAMPRKMLGVCCVLLFGFWNESASAWQFGGSSPRPAVLPRAMIPEQARDASVPLETRLAQQKEGRELFARDWSRPESKATPNGDGLGPMYNDVSCVACHAQGGTGGGGGNDKNVRLLHLVGTNGVALHTTKNSASVVKARQQVHPDFVGEATSVVLHRYERNQDGELNSYRKWLAKRLPQEFIDPETQLPAQASQAQRTVSPLDAAPRTFRSAGLPTRLTERNTPALFGAGLINSIPDAAIIEQAERQKKYHAPFISGRVPQNSRGEIGRFGWRGQVATLPEFVLAACSVELGLEVPGHSQARPVMARKEQLVQEAKDQADAGRRKSRSVDLTEEQCNSLTAYVASLSAPQTSRASGLNQAKSVQRGMVVFETIGCAACHVPDLGPVAGLYSDLLLHDMGSNLSDPSPAIPELNERTIQDGSGSAYGGPILRMELVKNSTTNIHQEWRTPPLWGVASSAPYLHDGRANTLEQAIQWHGGEGQRAAEAFRSLKPDERVDLLQFLHSLSVPGNDQVVMPVRFERLDVGGNLGGRSGGGFF